MFEDYLPESHAEEIQLLLHLVAPDVLKSAEMPTFFFKEGQRLDWPFFLHAAERHHLLPLLYRNLRETGLKERLPEKVKGALKAGYLEIVGRNMRLTQRLLDLLDLLEENGILAVPFKGPVLAEQLYGDPVLRQYSDIDILIAGNDAEKAWGVLLRAGYRHSSVELSRAQFAMYMRFENEIGLVDSSGYVAVDLQWKLSGHARVPFNLAFFRERLQPVGLAKQEIRGLSREDTLFHLCVHGADDGWKNLDMVLSVAVFLDRYAALDWELVFRLAEDSRYERGLWLGLFLARDLFGVGLPGEAAEKIAVDPAAKQLAAMVYRRMFVDQEDHKQGMGKKVAALPYQLRLRRDLVDKLIYLLRRFFLPQKKDWRIFGGIGSHFFWLLFILRPLRQIWELAGGKVRDYK